MISKLQWLLPLVLIIGTLAAEGTATADTTNALIMSQYNAVGSGTDNNTGGGTYLDKGKTDAQLGRVEGNGQNWLQFLTTKTDPGKNTLNLQGYEIDWAYDKGDGQSYGSGSITFSNDAAWARVPLGTAITINESQQAWYLKSTPATLPDGVTPNPDYDVLSGTGMQLAGSIDGLGALQGTAYDSKADKMLDFSTNTAWNPYAAAGANMAPGPNWNINVWAGQQSAGSFQYFSFAGSVTSHGVTSPIGTSASGLFSVNNDNWQFTIKDNHGNVVEGPIGESISGWTGGGISGTEIGKLQADGLQVGAHPTLAAFQNVGIATYADGSTSNYGGPSLWTDASKAVVAADLTPLRSWFNNIKPGDVNLDGIVNASDITTIASNWLHAGGGLLGGDANGDGIVNAADITLVASNWLQSGGAPTGATATALASPVPEPATWSLGLIGVVVVVAGRRFRRGSRSASRIERSGGGDFGRAPQIHARN